MTESPGTPVPLSAAADVGVSNPALSPVARLRRESRSWLAPFIEAVIDAGLRVIDLGCGQHYADACFLADSGFTVFACDRVYAHPTGSEVHAFAADIAEPLPVRTAAVDAVLASLSLHYFPWVTTIAIFAEIHRVLRPGGLLLFRVNAHDDLNYGAGIGEEIEPGYFHCNGEYGLPRKRCFTEDAIRAAVTGLFDISHLTHGSIDPYGAPKQVWECLARTSAGAH